MVTTKLMFTHLAVQENQRIARKRRAPILLTLDAHVPRALLEVIMLLKRTQEPLAAISKETRHAEESLFLRLGPVQCESSSLAAHGVAETIP
jgi:hypothetical protein